MSEIGRYPSFRSPRKWLERNKLLRKQLLIILALLIVSVALPQIDILRRYGLVILALPFVLIGGAMLLRWPALGIIVVILAGVTIPQIGFGQLNVSILLVGLLLGLSLLRLVVQPRESRIVSTRVMRPLLAMVAVSIISFVIGQLPWFSFARNAPLDAQVGGLAIFILSAGAFFLVASQVRDIRWLQAMTWIVVAIGGLVVLGRIWPLFGQLTRQLFVLRSIGSIFWAWLPVLTLSQALINRNLHPRWRLILGGLTLAILYTAFVQDNSWKSGWVPAFVGVAVIIALWSWRAGVILAVLGAIPAWLLANQALITDQYSFSTRIDAWQILLEIIKVSPFLGLGFANYYWYTPLFRIRGFTVQFSSHNNFVDIVAQTGLIGLACVLWFMFEIGRLGWRLRKTVPDGFARAYVDGALGGLVATLVAAMLGDWLLPFVYNVGLQGFRTGVLAWMFLGGLVALEQLYVNRTPDRPESKDSYAHVSAPG